MSNFETNTANNVLAIINSKAPFAESDGKDSLDVALIFASYEQGVSLFFQGDGVYQLMAGQDATILDIKDYLKTFSAFEFYDIEKVYVCEKSLNERMLSLTFHIEGVSILTADAFSSRLNLHKHILRF